MENKKSGVVNSIVEVVIKVEQESSDIRGLLILEVIIVRTLEEAQRINKKVFKNYHYPFNLDD